MIEIETFAFIDVEMSGLPVYNFGKTSIAEISIQTCSRQDMLKCSKDEIPRCLNKLVLCFNPSRMIHPRSTAFSGLDNYMLEDHNTFNENAADLIVNFFHHLRHPVCLVAHNGNAHDYPIINNTFQKLKKVLPEDILCIDSLPAFKYIGGENKQKKALENTENLAQKIDIENDKEFQQVLEGECAAILNAEHVALASPKRRVLPEDVCIDSLPAFKYIDEIYQQQDSENLAHNVTENDKKFQQVLEEEYATIINKEHDALASPKRRIFPEDVCIDSLPALKYIDKNNQQQDSENLAQKLTENDKKFQQVLEEEYATIINKEHDALASPKRRVLPEDVCIDSLPAFKSIDEIDQQQDSENLAHKVTENDTKFQQLLEEEYATIINREHDALASPKRRIFPEDVCIDSLPALKYIDKNNQQQDSENLAQKVLENDKKFQQVLEEEYATIINKEFDELATPKRKGINSSTDSKAGTDIFDEIINWKEINETTPQRPIEQKLHTLRNSDNLLSKERKALNLKRELFPSEGPTAITKNARKSYTLTSVYERCFGKKPKTVHHADDDVATLLKTVVFHGEEFVKYSQLYAKPISSIPALGSKS